MEKSPLPRGISATAFRSCGNHSAPSANCTEPASSEKLHAEEDVENDMRSLEGDIQAPARLFATARIRELGGETVSVREQATLSAAKKSSNSMKDSQPGRSPVRCHPKKLRLFSAYRQSVMDPACSQECDRSIASCLTWPLPQCACQISAAHRSGPLDRIVRPFSLMSALPASHQSCVRSEHDAA